MATGDEATVLAAAFDALGLGPSPPGVVVLADRPGRRRVARVGDIVVKAFSSAERSAWRREVAGLGAVAGWAFAPRVVATGERYCAVRWIDGVVPMDGPADEVTVHAAIGPVLAALHEVAPGGLAPWPVVDRLLARLAHPPPACPAALAADVARLVRPLLPLVTTDRFVHGDWGTANVLVGADDPTRVVAVIDFEDAHLGDAAEDFAWPVLAGPASDEVGAMARSYAARRSLGPHGVERLVVAGVEKCLDVLGWSMAPATQARFHDRCRRTLEELTAGSWPVWPTG